MRAWVDLGRCRAACTKERILLGKRSEVIPMTTLSFTEFRHGHHEVRHIAHPLRLV